MTTPAPEAAPASKKPRSAGITVFLRSIPIIVILLILGAWWGSSYLPMGTKTGCVITGIDDVEGGKGSDSIMIRSSCGDYHSSLPEQQLVQGGEYTFTLRGVFNTNVIDATPTDQTTEVNG